MAVSGREYIPVETIQMRRCLSWTRRNIYETDYFGGVDECGGDAEWECAATIDSAVGATVDSAIFAVGRGAANEELSVGVDDGAGWEDGAVPDGV